MQQREVDGAEGSEPDRQHRAGGVQDAIVDPDQVDAGEDVMAASDRFCPSDNSARATSVRARALAMSGRRRRR
jgi:hypothetical protein